MAMSVFLFVWNNRTMTMSVVQIILSQLATSTLISDHAVKWCMLGTGILTGLIALHNKVQEIRASKEPPNEP